VIFVQGCFWHGRDCKRSSRTTNTKYWSAKISHNKQCDAEHTHPIRKAGWRALKEWECEIKLRSLMQRMMRFLDR
jgi:DNA mismatch endonuclease (patch repair protein)